MIVGDYDLWCGWGVKPIEGGYSFSLFWHKANNDYFLLNGEEYYTPSISDFKEGGLYIGVVLLKENDEINPCK